MINRCTNKKVPSYKDYGGRGIRVCEKWLRNFEAFLADVGLKPTPEHTLGRKDNAKGYAPGNVRWETRSQNYRNRRSNTLLTVDGETKTLVEWAAASGLGRTTIKRRLVLGWSEREAVLTPVGGNACSPLGKTA